MFTAWAPAAAKAAPRRSTSSATNSPSPWGCAASTPSPRSTTTCWRYSDERLKIYRRPGQAPLGAEPGSITTDVDSCGRSNFQRPKSRGRGVWVPAFASRSRGRPVEMFSQESSHRRRDAVAADIDPIGVHRAVVFLHGAEDDDPCACFQFGLVARDECHDRRARRHHDFLFAVLVFHQDVLAVGALDRLGDGGIGHGRVGALIPWPEAFGRAALVCG